MLFVDLHHPPIEQKLHHCSYPTNKGFVIPSAASRSRLLERLGSALLLSQAVSSCSSHTSSEEEEEEEIYFSAVSSAAAQTFFRKSRPTAGCHGCPIAKGGHTSWPASLRENHASAQFAGVWLCLDQPGEQRCARL